jgi:dipeptidyl aminopeptidase/acylaminoacyl peptidase
VSQLAWSPGATALAVVCRVGVPGPKKQSAKERNAPRVVRGLGARLNGVGWKDGRTHVFIVEVGTGSAGQLTQGDYDHAAPSFSPDGSMVAFAADRQAGHDDRQWRSDVWVLPVTGGRPRRLARGKGYAVAPLFSPDGSLVAFAGTDNDRWDADSHVYVVAADGSGEPERVAPGTDRGVILRMAGTPAPYGWTGNRELVMLLADRGGTALHRARAGEARSHEVVGGDTEIDFVAVRPGRRVIAFTSAWVDRPCELYVTRSGDAEPVQLTHLHDEFLAEVDLAAAERARITRPDGTEVEYFTLLPRRSPRRFPVHLGVHGGPQDWWPGATDLGIHQTIVAAGYAVLLPNPRGSGGYGQEFASACTGDWGGADFEDILACCDDLVERGLGDGDRMFVSGYSYGGFMTGWAVGHSHRFLAATSGAAVIDL